VFRKHKIITGLLAIAGVLLLVGGVNWYLFSHRPYRQQLRLWKDEGGVTSVREMVGDRPPDEANAAVLYEAAFAELPDSWSLDDEERARLEEPLEAEELGPILEKYAGPLEQVRQGTQRDVCYWSTDYDAGIGALLPHLGPARTAAELLIAEAVVRSREGDAAGAMDSLCQALRLAEHVGVEPFMISQLVQIDYEMRVLEALESLFREQPLPESGEFERLLSGRNHRQRVQVTMRSDITGVLTALEAGTLGEFLEMIDGYESISPMDLALSRLLRGRDLAIYIELEREQVAFFSQPFYEQSGAEPWLDPPAWAVLSNSLPCSRVRMNARVAEAAARLAMARSALRLRAIRRETGSYPETLDAPVDPYSGEPLAYEKTATGFILRSAGMDEDGEPLEWRWE
jgi:hypothetical protein